MKEALMGRPRSHDTESSKIELPAVFSAQLPRHVLGFQKMRTASPGLAKMRSPMEEFLHHKILKAWTQLRGAIKSKLLI